MMPDFMDNALTDVYTGSYAGANFLQPHNNKKWFKETMQKNRKHRPKKKKQPIASNQKREW